MLTRREIFLIAVRTCQKKEEEGTAEGSEESAFEISAPAFCLYKSAHASHVVKKIQDGAGW